MKEKTQRRKERKEDVGTYRRSYAIVLLAAGLTIRS